ncbi:2-oxo acid dehydrogenase subunit E2 [Candidatus Synechococcus calcipolaris G9]|uniref:Dihydrolipoamide acetyltransferase component of pyruvate dehydrogenase complex n=1 Tax=Candidatus Synechococcus calcipolaris G9 TaxID=1497997 RepID=A0ABT6F170_9SYNE|nr:dihydrolipoamide acetyltransferase family protein [Candidatus Synechococcus calcipolaris]MDG2991605.1 2-oxo acid dehydrogenase subunit E2 [Candidatus Synechococcus calcipolaris G9]
MIRELFMPALSSTMTEGKIVSWVKSTGDKVEKGETVVIVESDKADMDVESFYEGYLAAIAVDAGETASVGATIGLVAETEAEIPEAVAKLKTLANGGSTSSPETSSAAAPAPSRNGGTVETPVATPVASGRLVASPRARKLAKEFKVDLKTLTGTGPNGRITAADVEAIVGQGSAPATTTVLSPSPKPAKAAPTPIAATASVKSELVPLTTLQNAVVRNMVASLEIPDFHVAYTITTDALDRLYKQIKPKGVTMTALLAKAIALTLEKHPIINACYSDQGIQYRSQINVACAVAMPGGGLITPVLQNAHQSDIYTLSRTWKDLVERARSKQLQPQEYNSGTFSLSNLGMYGVDCFDAILTPGQGAILAVGASKPQVVATDDGLLGIKRQMNVTITCDHRVIYGTDAASFLKDLAHLIETNPQALTL